MSHCIAREGTLDFATIPFYHPKRCSAYPQPKRPYRRFIGTDCVSASSVWSMQNIVPRFQDNLIVHQEVLPQPFL